MPENTRILVLVLFPSFPRPPSSRDLESIIGLRRLAKDLHAEGIRLIPCLSCPPWNYPIKVFEALLSEGMFDSPEVEYLWHPWERDWLEPTRRWWLWDIFPEVLHNVQKLIERRLVRGVVLLTAPGWREELITHELRRVPVPEFISPEAVLHLEMGQPWREERPLFPGIRSLWYPERREEIVAALRSLGLDRGEEAALSHPSRADGEPVLAHPEEIELAPALPSAGPLRRPLSAMRRLMDLAATASSTLSEILLSKGVKPEPDAVHLGASAPTRARPGDEFTARFSAYHPAFAEEAKKALEQQGAKTDPNQLQTTWKQGEEVRVVLVGEHLTAEPSAHTFTWEGMLNTVQFDVTVDSGVTERRRVLLRFDVYIQKTVVARVRLPLTIDSKPGFLEQLLVPEQQFFAEPAPQTAYASYAVADKADVMSRVDAIGQHAGINFFTECLSLDPSNKRKPALRKMIGGQDLFMLFWSWAAAQSDAVKWEWTTALRRPGKERIETQRLKPQDPEPVLPAELEGLGLSKGYRKSMQHTDRKFFIVGCVLSVFVAGLILWAFALGTLTPDQRELMRVLLPLLSGFAAGSFVGAFTVQAKGLIPGVLATATGGFGVWLLTAFVLLPDAPLTFGVVVQPHGPGGIMDTLKEGTVSLQVGEQLRQQPIDQNGQARFSGISIEFEGQQVPVRARIPGFQMRDPELKVELRRGEARAVPMVPASP